MNPESLERAKRLKEDGFPSSETVHAGTILLPNGDGTNWAYTEQEALDRLIELWAISKS